MFSNECFLDAWVSGNQSAAKCVNESITWSLVAKGLRDVAKAWSVVVSWIALVHTEIINE